jgi:acyl-CoA carboxylase subunit beta
LAVDADEAYTRELEQARAATGFDEAVLTGEGTVFGRRVAAVERATAERLPLLASPSSGGTRMQDGTVAFLQMAKIAAAVTQHKRAHLTEWLFRCIAD